MIQNENYGTPLASALRVLSAEFRNERMMRAEEKGRRGLPAIMTVPLILFILPVLFIVILGPAACSISDNLMSGSLGRGGGTGSPVRSFSPRNVPQEGVRP
jgi:tight adherence protein C